MFKSARWRTNKNTIKEVFKLQFHATQVTQLGGDALLVSVIPVDVGKPTVKSEKATVRDGSCRWENPIYETIKFVREPRTGKIKESVYNFVVSSGSPKGSVLGEVSVDFADYAEATKSSCVALPLKNSNFNAIMHVTIQRLQTNVDLREVECGEEANVNSEDRSFKNLLSNKDADESVSIDEGINRTTQIAELNRRASIGSDITLSSSDSGSGLGTPRELGSRDPSNFLSSLSHTSVQHEPDVYARTNIYDEHQRLQWAWSADSEHGASTDGSTKSSHETLPRERSQQSSDDDIEKLKAELLVLARQADMSELELQTLRKQIVKETKRGQDLSREVISLKEERDSFKAECEKLKSFWKRVDDAKVKNRFQLEGGDLRTLVDEIRQELSCEKDMTFNLRLQLQKTQESNSDLILAVRDLEEILEQKNSEIANPSNRPESCGYAAGLKETISKGGTSEDEEQMELEDLVKDHSNATETHLLERQIAELYGEIEIYRRDKDELEMQMEQLALDYEILKQENHDMSYKLEQSQLQEQLKMQYECSSPSAFINELEYQVEDLETELKKQSEDFSNSLATIKELESHIKSLEEELKKQAQVYEADLEAVTCAKVAGLETELKKQSEDFSNSLATIKELEFHLKSLEEELEKQAQVFEADLEAVTCAKVEQEQRAIRAEDALRKTRSKNANTAERLQEEFRRLSVQMASTFDANEKVALRAMTEASELCEQKSHLEELVQKMKDELQGVRNDCEARLQKLSNHLDEKTKEMEKILLEMDNNYKQLDHQQKQEEEVKGNLSQVILQLKSQIQRLTAENNSLSEQVEESKNLRADLEQVKKSIEEAEMWAQRGNAERNELVSKISTLKKEAEKSLEDLNTMRHLKDEKEVTVGLLKSEIEELKARCKDFKHAIYEDEVEKEKLKKQVFQLKADLKKKEDALTTAEKKLKESNGCAIVSDGIKTTQRSIKSLQIARGSKEVACMKERIKLLEGQIKSKEAALGTSTASFLEKEKDFQNIIEELESMVEEINQNSASQKVTEDAGSDKIASEQEPRLFTADNRYSDLLTELASLKERNISMESELKEMQERYSEISLKFAEVEGERQQLVMTVRILKNSKRS
ncbi:myosin heavy chain, cardiac muscle isoform-like [Pyrus x bretschneideri]|uniref:myosin heavy chain, cardiac muscle isoform-like n=1 Tax=Pyrus x bretschneideri TaxID=225117 RepID=UPI00202F0ADE|nr:myosin heavy chain, cardiac muscle isoform-like [Pyrus x bretschneideri]